ncbi:MAG: hypothetical protein V7719_18645 [Psychroserpens sp.]|uniref:hypothetical protein n=1 Tax=Psychroserpens sp. TaxID=2020870 RepID=UPI00300112EE
MKTSRNLFHSILMISLFISLFSGCNDSPDTYVYLGSQMPKTYAEEIRSLNLLENNEKIKYFYSDGFYDIKEGFYFVTDQKLVAYNESWEEPKTIIFFNEIISLDVEYNESFYEDSFIMVETNEMELDFPVSSERKRDKDFYNYLLKKSNLD